MLGHNVACAQRAYTLLLSLIYTDLSHLSPVSISYAEHKIRYLILFNQIIFK